MTQHYYSEKPNIAHDEKQVIFEVLDRQFHCVTDAGVFSRDGVDMGTRILLEALPEVQGRVLDLGCGWGAVGVVIGKKYPQSEIVMTDINLRAVETARKNLLQNGIKNAETLQGDGFENVSGKFDFILLNPPIRTGKENIYGMFSAARGYLSDAGALYIVIRKQQGAESAQKYLQTIYADVERLAREKGYWVLRCARPVVEEA